MNKRRRSSQPIFLNELYLGEYDLDEEGEWDGEWGAAIFRWGEGDEDVEEDGLAAIGELWRTRESDDRFTNRERLYLNNYDQMILHWFDCQNKSIINHWPKWFFIQLYLISNSLSLMCKNTHYSTFVIRRRWIHDKYLSIRRWLTILLLMCKKKIKSPTYRWRA